MTVSIMTQVMTTIEARAYGMHQWNLGEALNCSLAQPLRKGLSHKRLGMLHI